MDILCLGWGEVGLGIWLPTLGGVMVRNLAMILDAWLSREA